MNLVIDIGNTMTKACVLDDGKVVERMSVPELSIGGIESLLTEFPAITKAILSSTREDNGALEGFLSERVPFFIRQNHTVPIPLKNNYRSPETLGQDRLAAAVGASMLYPAQNLLIVDFGTAITIDVVTAGGEYLGGNISPGAMTRFRALRDYTGRLPLCELRELNELLGGTTEEAIVGGVVNGIVFELEGYIGRVGDKMGDLRVIFTGGDAKFFEKRFKNTIFANYDLVITGLDRILEYNALQK